MRNDLLMLLLAASLTLIAPLCPAAGEGYLLDLLAKPVTTIVLEKTLADRDGMLDFRFAVRGGNLLVQDLEQGSLAFFQMADGKRLTTVPFPSGLLQLDIPAQGPITLLTTNGLATVATVGPELTAEALQQALAAATPCQGWTPAPERRRYRLRVCSPGMVAVLDLTEQRARLFSLAGKDAGAVPCSTDCLPTGSDRLLTVLAESGSGLVFRDLATKVPAGEQQEFSGIEARLYLEGMAAELLAVDPAAERITAVVYPSLALSPEEAAAAEETMRAGGPAYRPFLHPTDSEARFGLVVTCGTRQPMTPLAKLLFGEFSGTVLLAPDQIIFVRPMLRDEVVLTGFEILATRLGAKP